MRRSGIIFLIFALVGPGIGGISHAGLMALLEHQFLRDEGLTFLVWLVPLSYAIGLIPALIVGSAVAWRSGRTSGATLPFALTTAILVPIVIVTVIAIAFNVAAGTPIIDEDPVWRTRGFQEFVRIVALLTLHSAVATIACWLIARRQRLV